MIGLLQRVTAAEVTVDGRLVGAIERGLLVFVGVERGDCARNADRLLQRLLGYRVFPDETGKMNRSLVDVAGALMLIPQFTLPADTRKGTRPSFTPAASPEEGDKLFRYLLAQAQSQHTPVTAGRFGATMQVTLTNDGPVTFLLRASPGSAHDGKRPATPGG
jgi:D-tyrosyl-tRNA(Tyr) deacylase